jgi:hypothetical protein
MIVIFNVFDVFSKTSPRIIIASFFSPFHNHSKVLNAIGIIRKGSATGGYSRVRPNQSNEFLAVFESDDRIAVRQRRAALSKQKSGGGF